MHNSKSTLNQVNQQVTVVYITSRILENFESCVLFLFLNIFNIFNVNFSTNKGLKTPVKDSTS